MNKKNRHSSVFKVGFLTLSAIAILIFTVLWVKGRSLSAGERIDVAFSDVNGMRAGSGVQMMGLRIGQVEEITPVINGKDSYIRLRFVVTEKGVKIPLASTISIQQSGIIGEQFLEVTPPKTQIIYDSTNLNDVNISPNSPIYMKLSDGDYEIGKVVEAQILKKTQLPYNQRSKIKTKNALKLSYYIDLPGLILDNDELNIKYKNDKIVLSFKDGEIPLAPKKDLKYTIVEPMRLSDFMDLQFRAARSLAQTNEKVSEILSDEFISSIQSSANNIKELTITANTTLDKASLLIDSSKAEISDLIKQTDELIISLTRLSNNVNEIVSDEKIKNDVLGSIKSIGKMSDNVNKILEDKQTKDILANLDETLRNLNEISLYVNEYTKDPKLKEEITTMIANLTNITTNISNVMNDYNGLEEKDKMKLRNTIKDIGAITSNIKKFSEKLNKRFLLFRLMF